MSEIVITFFDEDGDRWDVNSENDMQMMCNEFLDEDLVNIYKSTRYFHELEMAKLELIELGLLTQEKGVKYSPSAVILGANIMANSITKRLGKEILQKCDSEVDISWQQNKPDLSKYKK